MDLSYSFGSANNGRISSETDNISGEAVIYTYDALNRLTQTLASGTCSMGFTYHGTSLYFYDQRGRLFGKYTPVWAPTLSGQLSYPNSNPSHAQMTGQPNL